MVTTVFSVDCPIKVTRGRISFLDPFGNGSDAEETVVREAPTYTARLDYDQFVTETTHIKGHILDIVLSRARKLVRSITVENLHLSDHFFLTIGADLSRPSVP